MPLSGIPVFNGLALLQEQADFLASSSAADINTTSYLKIKLAAQHKRTAQRNQYSTHPAAGGSGAGEGRPFPSTEESPINRGSGDVRTEGNGKGIRFAAERAIVGGSGGGSISTSATIPARPSARAHRIQSVESVTSEGSTERRRSCREMENDGEDDLHGGMVKKAFRGSLGEEGVDVVLLSPTDPYAATTSHRLGRSAPTHGTETPESNDTQRMEGEKEALAAFSGGLKCSTASHAPVGGPASRTVGQASIAEMELRSSRLAALAEQKERQPSELGGGQTPIDVFPPHYTSGNESMPAVSSRRAQQLEKEGRGAGPSRAAPHALEPRFSGVRGGVPLEALESWSTLSGEPGMARDLYTASSVHGAISQPPSSSSAFSGVARHSGEHDAKALLDTPYEDGPALHGTGGSRSVSSGSRREAGERVVGFLHDEGGDHQRRDPPDTSHVDPHRWLRERGIEGGEGVKGADENAEGRRRGKAGSGVSPLPLEATTMPLSSISPFSPLYTKHTGPSKTPLSYHTDEEEEERENPTAFPFLSAPKRGSAGPDASGEARSRVRNHPSFMDFPPSEYGTGRDGKSDSAPRQRVEDSHSELTSSISIMLDSTPAVATGEMLFSEGPEVMEVTLVPCDCCGRRFAEDRLPRHREACEKQKKQEWIRHKNTRGAKAVQQGRLHPPHLGGSFSGGAGGEYASFAGEPYHGGGGNANRFSPSSNGRTKGKTDWRK